MIKHRNGIPDQSVSVPNNYPYPKPTEIEPKTIQYNGIHFYLAGKHRKDKYGDVRQEIALRLDGLLVKASDLIVEKRYGEALNFYINDIFPIALRLIVNVERWMVREIKKDMEKRLAESVLGLEPSLIVDPEELLNTRLNALVPYFYGMMNEQISSLVTHLEKCKEERKDGWDPSFLRQQHIMRCFELYCGEFKGNNWKKKPVYVGEKYRYLITKAVFTSWKMFLFMYSLDTGIGFPAIKEEVWFKLDEYLNKTKATDLGNIPKDKTELKPMVPSTDLVVASKTGVSNVLTGAVSKEIIDATVEKYKAKEEEDPDAVIDAIFGC